MEVRFQGLGLRLRFALRYCTEKLTLISFHTSTTCHEGFPNAKARHNLQRATYRFVEHAAASEF